MSLRITLINPPLPLQEVIQHPPLGLGYIAMMLKKAGHKVNIVDMPISNTSYDLLKSEIKIHRPDLIGISAMTKTFAEGIVVAETCKEALPDVPIVMGGPHVTFKPEETLERHRQIDLVTVYEAEYSIPELANALEKGESLKGIDGIAFRENGAVVRTKVRAPIDDLDSLPYPDRRMYPLDLYLRKDDETTIITARGCPYRCKFCSTTIMGRYLRTRSIGNVMPEIEHIISCGFKSLFISDDTFTCNRNRVIAMCDEFIRSGLDFRWTCNMRIDNAWPEMLVSMKKAGCYRVFVGAESSAASVLANIDKRITQDQTLKAVRMIQKTGIEVHASFALGMPGETPKTIEDTVKFAKKLKPDFISFNILTPYPGTDIFDNNEKYGVVFDKLWYENRNWPYAAISGLNNLSSDKLGKLVKKAYIDYCS